MQLNLLIFALQLIDCKYSTLKKKLLYKQTLWNTLFNKFNNELIYVDRLLPSITILLPSVEENTYQDMNLKTEKQFHSVYTSMEGFERVIFYLT